MKHHNKSKSIIAAGLVVLAILGFFAFQCSWFTATSDERPANDYSSSIEQLESSVDMDGDGLDDQRDILASALAYIAAQPKYKSAYYQGGYPDDGYGVCTDVVAQALKGAGYDLMELVNQDMEQHPEAYGNQVPDPNIDFRRVKNLHVYLQNNAISLTTDVTDIQQWQGGDIVVFEKHIGVVSDRRNADGVPYVIHHNSPAQKNYEQDILQSRSDIVGHYRISE